MWFLKSPIAKVDAYIAFASAYRVAGAITTGGKSYISFCGDMHGHQMSWKLMYSWLEEGVTSPYNVKAKLHAHLQWNIGSRLILRQTISSCSLQYSISRQPLITCQKFFYLKIHFPIIFTGSFIDLTFPQLFGLVWSNKHKCWFFCVCAIPFFLFGWSSCFYATYRTTLVTFRRAFYGDTVLINKRKKIYTAELTIVTSNTHSILHTMILVQLYIWGKKVLHKSR